MLPPSECPVGVSSKCQSIWVYFIRSPYPFNHVFHLLKLELSCFAVWISSSPSRIPQTLYFLKCFAFPHQRSVRSVKIHSSFMSASQKRPYEWVIGFNFETMMHISLLMHFTRYHLSSILRSFPGLTHSDWWKHCTEHQACLLWETTLAGVILMQFIQAARCTVVVHTEQQRRIEHMQLTEATAYMYRYNGILMLKIRVMHSHLLTLAAHYYSYTKTHTYKWNTLRLIIRRVSNKHHIRLSHNSTAGPCKPRTPSWCHSGHTIKSRLSSVGNSFSLLRIENHSHAQPFWGAGALGA